MSLLYRAEFDSSIGALRVFSTDLGLAYVELAHASGRGFAGWKQRHLSDTPVHEAFAPNKQAVAEILEYLEGKRSAFSMKLDLRATLFQREVYDRVAAIPFGETRSYGEIASEMGRPAAVRAVGAANGANPIPLVIPCHRVIASSGQLQGYAGGLELKAKLLAMERSQPGQGWLL